MKSTKGQIDDLIGEINLRAERGERVLVTTLTKKMAEDLTDYLLDNNIRTRYLHSEVDTLRRIELLRELRLGLYDVLVGINLLREGLDLPEVSLVAILDADKEGFLRSGTSLIQTIGRAARNVSGQVIMYADRITDSMAKAIDETNRRRAKQVAYNLERGVDPQPLRRRIADITDMLAREDADTAELLGGGGRSAVPRQVAGARAVEPRPAGQAVPTGWPGCRRRDLADLIQQLTDQMHAAAAELQFEVAARFRDEIRDLKKELRQMVEVASTEMDGTQLREYCLAKPGAWPDEPWDGDAVAKVHVKIFAFLGDDSVGVKCGSSREEADEWLARYPEDAAVMAYIGRSGWNTLRLSGAIPDEDLREAVDESYAMVVSKIPKKHRPAGSPG